MKNITLIIILLVLRLSISAQSDSCKVLPGKISGIYTGKCMNGLANGKGKSIGEDTYIGTFKDGLPDGKGKYLFKNGDIFQGYWQNGQKDGKGKFEYTLNGKKCTLIGYWRKDEYVGVNEPDVAYRVTSSTGIMNYGVEKNESANELDKAIAFSIKSAFTDFAPTDLKINKSSGQIVRNGKKFSITQYICPLHCEISYSILVAESRKQCRFIIEILEEGKYSVTLNND
ncbi:MAG: hypothetical protein IPN08_15455 [Bacteroidales bacterium]|nr:hypothetical protein [Bacteroidales bacterium]MBK9358753.1 hypothetical protein [Bacteroidales bacterium]